MKRHTAQNTGMRNPGEGRKEEKKKPDRGDRYEALIGPDKELI
jgi:hypothetical protein